MRGKRNYIVVGEKTTIPVSQKFMDHNDLDFGNLCFTDQYKEKPTLLDLIKWLEDRLTYWEKENAKKWEKNMLDETKCFLARVELINDKNLIVTFI